MLLAGVVVADDAIPIPPGDPQGLPPRPVPYAALPGNMQFVRCAPIEGQPEALIALIYDSPDTRVVTYWAVSAFAMMARRMLALVGEAELTIADENDLKKLRDIQPFERP